jgi:hypothetical protein
LVRLICVERCIVLMIEDAEYRSVSVQELR